MYLGRIVIFALHKLKVLYRDTKVFLIRWYIKKRLYRRYYRSVYFVLSRSLCILDLTALTVSKSGADAVGGTK